MFLFFLFTSRNRTERENEEAAENEGVFERERVRERTIQVFRLPIETICDFLMAVLLRLGSFGSVGYLQEMKVFPIEEKLDATSTSS